MKPELLMPAGTFQKMEYAFAYGADAVYLGVPVFSLRARDNDFDHDELKRAVSFAHAQNKKVYVTANIFSRNSKINRFELELDSIMECSPDAMIMSDPGLMASFRERYPDVPVHLSVQANCMNWQSVKFWNRSLNVSRIILSRELTIDEIAEIKQRVPEVELEAFVHGSICIAYSGRCMLSSYMSTRDANSGVCDNTCREKFKTHTYLEDLRNPGEMYPIEEDSEGTYIMNAKDLCLIEHLGALRDAGVCSFKAEGRTKSLNYAALVARAYRQAIDDLEAGKPYDPRLYGELQKTANRDFHEGFIRGNPGAQGQRYDRSLSRRDLRSFAGLMTGEMRDSFVEVDVRTTMRPGDSLELLGPDMASENFIIQEILNKDAAKIDVAHSGGGRVWIKGPTKSLKYGILSGIK